jgi:hypothetical protein
MGLILKLNKLKRMIQYGKIIVKIVLALIQFQFANKYNVNMSHVKKVKYIYWQIMVAVRHVIIQKNLVNMKVF